MYTVVAKIIRTLQFSINKIIYNLEKMLKSFLQTILSLNAVLNKLQTLYFLSLPSDMFMLCVKTEKPHTQGRSRMRMTKVFTKPNIPMSNTQSISKPNGYPKVRQKYIKVYR